MRAIMTRLGMLTAMLLAFLTTSAYDFEVDGLGYTVISHTELTCEVSALVESNLNDVKIPETVTFSNRELKVVSIGDKVFAKSSISSIEIPSSILKFDGGSTFKGCKNLTKVTFDGDCKIKVIPTSCFADCEHLELIKLPISVTTIGKYAFENSAIKSIGLSAVSYIGGSAFIDCKNLSEITLSGDYCDISELAFRRSGLTIVHIPETCNLKLSKQGVFMECNYLQSISFPKQLSLKEEYNESVGIFEGCSSLNQIVWPSTVPVIPNRAFKDCYNLSFISLPDNLEGIEEEAFRNCALEEMMLPSSVTSISYGAFNNCRNLEDFKLSGTLALSLYWDCEYKNQHNGKIEHEDRDFTFKNCPIKKLTIPEGDSISFFKYVNRDSTRGLMRLSGASVSNSLPSSITHLSINNSNLMGGSTEWGTSYNPNTHEYYFTGQVENKYERIKLSFPNLISLELGGKLQDVECLDWNFPELKTLTCYRADPPDLPPLPNKYYMEWEVIVPGDCLEVYKNSPGWKNFWNLKGDPNISLIEYNNLKEYIPEIISKVDLNGMPVNEDYSGIIIIKFSDGTVKKVIRKY